MVIEGKPSSLTDDSFTLGLYPASGQKLTTTGSSPIKLSFDCNGIWQKKLVDLSASPDWTGRMNYIRMNLFDDSGVGVAGQGFDLSKVKFFRTLDEATAFIDGVGDTRLHGDADGNGKVDLLDVTFILKSFTDSGGPPSREGDYNDDGTVNLADASLILRKIAA